MTHLYLIIAIAILRWFSSSFLLRLCVSLFLWHRQTQTRWSQLQSVSSTGGEICHMYLADVVAVKSSAICRAAAAVWEEGGRREGQEELLPKKGSLF